MVPHEAKQLIDVGRSRSPLAVSPAPRDVWHRLLEQDAHALAFQTPTWLDCVCETSGYVDSSRMYMLDGQLIVLPMVRRTFGPMLATQASLPFGWGTGGFVATQPLTATQIALIFADLARLRTLRVAVRPNPLLRYDWAMAAPIEGLLIPRIAHVLDLQGGFEQVWTKRFSGKVRTHVRKAEKSGLQIQCDTAGALVSSFYELYVQSIERWAQQHHEPRLLARWRNQRHDPIDKFKRVAERLGENCQIWLAQLGGQPVAAMIVLRQGANASYWRGAMNKSLATQTRANDLLQQLAIEDACRSGCHFYHMGETGASRSLAHFKECFGAQAFDYHEYRLERLPLTRLDTRLRGIVKRLLRFRDA